MLYPNPRQKNDYGQAKRPWALAVALGYESWRMVVELVDDECRWESKWH